MLPRLSFSTSHCRDRAVFALTLDQPVGIDIELIRPLENLSGIAERTMTRTERQHLDAAHGRERLHRFYRIWTLKEAFLKATGRGFSLSPKVISFSPQQSHGVAHKPHSNEATGEWSFWHDDERDAMMAIALRAGTLHASLEPRLRLVRLARAWR